MKKVLSITVHPSALDGEYLSVSDAMHQVLDIIHALECLEEVQGASRKIVWRLTEARTNSPPFTLTTEAYPSDPVMSVGLEASRIITVFEDGIVSLLRGAVPDSFDRTTLVPIKRVFKRTLNGIGRTEFAVDDAAVVPVTPVGARAAIAAIERSDIEDDANAIDLRRTEFGSAEIIVCGLTQWNGKRALAAVDRLSGQKITCVLEAELAARLGREHQWEEAWDGRRLLATGALHYSTDGSLKRIDAVDAAELPWTDVPLSDLQGIDLLQGRSVSDHLQLLRGSERG